MVIKFFILTLIGQVLWFSLALAAPVALGDAGGANSNPHNLSYQSTNTIKASSSTDTRICIFCHTPHGATAQSTLWSRLDPDTTPFATFNPAWTTDGNNVFAIDDPAIVTTTLYNSTTYEYPNGASKLCLSCHDGVTAIGVLADGTAISLTFSTMSAAGGDTKSYTHGGGSMDLTHTHPISFVYTQAVVDYILATAKVDKSYKLPAAASRIKLDAQNRVQCTICHEPHSDTNDGTYTLPFWRNYGVGADQAADYTATCVECHSENAANPHTI